MKRAMLLLLIVCLAGAVLCGVLACREPVQPAVTAAGPTETASTTGTGLPANPATSTDLLTPQPTPEAVG